MSCFLFFRRVSNRSILLISVLHLLTFSLRLCWSSKNTLCKYFKGLTSLKSIFVSMSSLSNIKGLDLCDFTLCKERFVSFGLPLVSLLGRYRQDFRFKAQQSVTIFFQKIIISLSSSGVFKSILFKINSTFRPHLPFKNCRNCRSLSVNGWSAGGYKEYEFSPVDKAFCQRRMFYNNRVCAWSID